METSSKVFSKLPEIRKPKVSVCVIAYNSAKTVIETLDSIYAQTYPYLELIISDDCSKDDTVELCRRWLDKYKDRFCNSKLVVAAKNGGVGKNDNVAFSYATGDWIKPIAGDDMLFPNCISDNVCFVSSHPDVIITFSRARIAKPVDGKLVVTDEYLTDNAISKYCTLSAEEQYNHLLYSNFVPGVTSFVKREFVVTNPVPETYFYLEDWPYWLHLTKVGVKLNYFDKDTVIYRAGGSLRHSEIKSFLYPKFFDSCKAFFYTERYNALLDKDPLTAGRFRKEFLLGEIAIVLLNNKRNLFNRAILKVFKFLLGVRKLP